MKRRRKIASDEQAEPLTNDETASWERLLGKAADDEGPFERKRRDAQAKRNLGELKDSRKVATLRRQPLLPGGSVQLPRFAGPHVAAGQRLDAHGCRVARRGARLLSE